MAIKIPSGDGEVNVYNATTSTVHNPKVFYVNGIRTEGRDHARTATMLSILTERPINGIYNKTGGALADLGQSALDYLQNAGARASSSKLTPSTNIPTADIPRVVEEVIRKSFVWNKGTVSLFRQLMLSHSSRRFVVAHSQGNMLTSNALFIIEKVFGSAALKTIRVFSLASPSPGWPVGLRITNGGGGRQENAFMNDMVALLRPHNLAAKVGVKKFQNAGDFRTHPEGGVVGVRAHDIPDNMGLNFLQSIRNDLGLTPNLDPKLLENAAKRAEQLALLK
jgi:hypothetical protein